MRTECDGIAPGESAPEQEAAPAAPPTRFTASRIAVFLGIASLILMAAGALVWVTWSHFTDRGGGVAGFLAVVLPALAFLPATLLGHGHSGLGLRAVYGLTAVWLGFLNYFVFAALACWIVADAAWLVGWPLDGAALAGVLFGAAGLTAVAGMINAACLRVRRIRVPLPHLPEAWRGRGLALVTDLHVGHLSGPAFLRRVLKRLRGLEPRAVLIGGDLFDGTTAGVDGLIAPWRDFTAPLGVFYVSGNHEEFEDRTLYLGAVERAGIRVLRNEKVVLDGLQLVGVLDGEGQDAAVLAEALRRAALDPAAPSVLLIHQPEHPGVAAEASISLQLSGHTHRGQLWPWSWLVRRIYGAYAYGLSRCGAMWTYTSSGAGTWGPPLRVGTASEIVWIEFEEL